MWFMRTNEIKSAEREWEQSTEIKSLQTSEKQSWWKNELLHTVNFELMYRCQVLVRQISWKPRQSWEWIKSTLEEGHNTWSRVCHTNLSHIWKGGKLDSPTSGTNLIAVGYLLPMQCGAWQWFRSRGSIWACDGAYYRALADVFLQERTLETW